MKGPQAFALLVNVFMNIILGILLTICVDVSIELRLGVQFMTPEIVIGTIISSFAVGFTAGTLVPAMDWGMKIASAFKLAPNSIATYLICAVTLGACMGFCITFGNFLIADLGSKGLSGAMSDILFNLPVIMVLAMCFVPIFLKPVQSLCVKITGFDPSKMSLQDAAA